MNLDDLLYNDMQPKGLASIDTSERAILALTLLTNLARERDKLYRFLMACAGPRYQPDYWYWQNRFFFT